jgi:hypothetical protein
MEGEMAKFKVGEKLTWIGEKGEFYTRGKQYEVLAEPYADIPSACYILEDDKGNRHSWSQPEIGKKFESSSGPIRTVTRREIVPGNYGTVGVQTVFNGKIGIFVPAHQHSPEELRSAARIFNEIADVLDEQSAEAKGEAA